MPMKTTSTKTLTATVKQLDVVVLAVHALGGDRKSVDTEDIAVKSHELAPGMFTWQKYPGQINLELVRVNLSNAKKKTYGTLLTGSGREGWRLSARGLNWVTSNAKRLLKGGLQWSAESRTAGSVDTMRKRREKKRLLASRAWETWHDSKPISVRDARALFRIDEYSTGKMSEIKVVRLQALFDDDGNISPFLKDAGVLVMETGGSK